MKRVSGIGGVFFKCKNPEKMRNWYQLHLGIDTDQYGSCFEWKPADDPEKKGFTQWSPMKENTNYFEPSKSEFMINYQVEDLVKLVEILKQEGIIFIDEIKKFEYGKFNHLLDIEGNKIELWEPNDIEFDKIVVGRTK
jgi:predicted enzyme related to lactoylglutathione lyase